MPKPLVSAKHSPMLKSVMLLTPNSMKKKGTGGMDDNQSLGPSQYQSIYQREQLKEKGMFMHEFLGESEYN